MAALFLAGCAGTAEELDSSGPAAGGTVVVEGEAGEELEVPVTNETGAIVGEVLTDAGFGLPGARVTVIGAPESAVTNQTGWFRVLDVPPGERILRAEAQHYNPAESQIVVEAGKAKRVTVTMVPVEAQAGYRPHTHDYWGEATEVTVIDDEFEWRPTAAHGPLEPVEILLDTVLPLQQTSCAPSNPSRPSSATSPFHFTDPAQLVWFGTGRIEVTVYWDATDYTGGDRMALVWRPGNADEFRWTISQPSGQVHTVEVQPDMWDSGHQPFTFWEFYVCLWGSEEDPTASAQRLGRTFRGTYDVVAKLVKEYPVVAEPPHPRFWENASALAVQDTNRNISCVASFTFCYQPATRGRGSEWDKFVFQPWEDRIVPPGTQYLNATLSWSVDPAVAPSPTLSLSYSPANVPPWEKRELTKYVPAEPSREDARSQTYRIEVAPGESDGFYQTRSNWWFAWNVDGEESSETYVHSCACELRIQLIVEGVNDQATESGAA